METARMKWSVNVDILDRGRILRGMTQAELAVVARVDAGTLSDLFRRRRRPTFGTLTAVCRALQLELAEVINIHH